MAAEPVYKRPKTKLDALNKLRDDSQQLDFATDHSMKMKRAGVEVVFRDHEQRLVRELSRADTYVLGCVAWFTNVRVLRAMRGKSLGIVVQKEDFLRPDEYADNGDWRAKLRTLYDEAVCMERKPSQFIQFDFHTRLYDITEPGVHQHLHSSHAGAFRCVGYSKEVSALRPLMHHKFLVLGTLDRQTLVFRPQRVWTGSMNLSATANQSFENCVLIADERIAQQYTKEWAQLYFCSEPLDWDDPYPNISTEFCAPPAPPN